MFGIALAQYRRSVCEPNGHTHGHDTPEERACLEAMARFVLDAITESDARRDHRAAQARERTAQPDE